jgi:hypothetical protein
MNVIDFFGCSFTESPDMIHREFNIGDYSKHCQITKPISNFLQFDVTYNNISECQINNYGKGSFGNFTIHNVIRNKAKRLNIYDTNIAIVQLSALLRNEHSWKSIQDVDYDSDVFDIDFNSVRADYFVEGVGSLVEYYQKHIDNFKSIIETLKSNYDKFIIFFGWDFTTNEFNILFTENKLDKIINTYEYDYPLSNLQYFENDTFYSEELKRYKGTRGGLLDYCANKLTERMRYVSDRDHHPSYFSNKLFYLDIIKPFICDVVKLNKNYFDEDDVIKFETFLIELLNNKYSGEKWENYSYSELHHEIEKIISK